MVLNEQNILCGGRDSELRKWVGQYFRLWERKSKVNLKLKSNEVLIYLVKSYHCREGVPCTGQLFHHGYFFSQESPSRSNLLYSFDSSYKWLAAKKKKKQSTEKFMWRANNRGETTQKYTPRVFLLDIWIGLKNGLNMAWINP